MADMIYSELVKIDRLFGCWLLSYVDTGVDAGEATLEDSDQESDSGPISQVRHDNLLCYF